MRKALSVKLNKPSPNQKPQELMKALLQPTVDELLTAIQAANMPDRDKLQLAYRQGYHAGKQSIPDPLYNEFGEQIREVTQAELDWTL